VLRRISKKQKPSRGYVLQQLRAGAWDAFAYAAPRRWSDSVVLRNYFRRILARATRVPAIRTRPVSAQAWNEAAEGVRGAWAVAKEIAEEVGCAEDASDMEGGEQTSLTGFGLLLTWHTLLGRSDPTLGTLIAQGVRGQALAERLSSLPFVDEAFEAFCAWVDAARQEAGYGWWACCFELCFNGDYVGRIHQHAFMCVDPARLDTRAAVTPPSVPAARLVYDGQAPLCRPVVLTGRRRHSEAAFSGGMYYVLAEKEGSLRVRGNKALFLDPGHPMCQWRRCAAPGVSAGWVWFGLGVWFRGSCSGLGIGVVGVAGVVRLAGRLCGRVSGTGAQAGFSGMAAGWARRLGDYVGL